MCMQGTIFTLQHLQYALLDKCFDRSPHRATIIPFDASVVTPDSASSYRKKDNDSTKGTAFIHTYAHAHNI